VNTIEQRDDNRAQLAWRALLARSELPISADALAVADMFAPELRSYCELVQAPGAASIGLMFRGEDRSFSQRTLVLMEAWGMPPEGIEQFGIWADLFEHKRAFLKLEWHRSAQTGQIERLIAFYFRRRPAVGKALGSLQSRGVRLEVLDRVARLASLLGKASVHFVSGALRPGHALRHKFYFSQYLTPDTAPLLSSRVLAAMEWFGVDPGARALIGQHHATLAAPDREATIFVSCSFTATAFIPSMKIDYPDVAPAAAAALLPIRARGAAEAEIATLCTAAGLERLSYLGVRLNQAGPPGLKYYADL